MGALAISSIEAVDPALVEAFKRAMGLTASAVTVITAGEGEAVRGLTATAVSSVSIAPPTLLICVNREGDAHRAISRAGAFCVNVLAEANQPVADRFAGRQGLTGAEKFQGADWSRLVTGAPALDGALVSIDCTLAESVEAYTHTVFFGTVRAVRLGPAAPPLIHFDRAYRSLA
ncbi:flavin reductase family protein [Ancylobacter sp. WKF20]|uniref:flavin reductase family protein n=1 Tax=Ancylobacter sp. WKF20 TaxID=3039801 RepID=UPI0024340D58|nr:flavin reductase family protein [Ancylobacter sp. WKF20]WGD30277.1 flavin reductase family protein [Ancylobacter sp. WKF20]